MIDRAASADPHLRALLTRHPFVRNVETGENPGVDFVSGRWHRSVRIDDFSIPNKGLVELADNNPMVCADAFSVPSAAGVLALIAFGPLIDAGLLLEAPTLILSTEASEESVWSWLATIQFSEGVTLHIEPQNLGTVIAATGLAVIPTPGDWSEIDALYEERFGRSFFVRCQGDGEWATSLVQGKPKALYRLSYTPDEPNSLLTIHLLADVNGKCGAAEVLHAMNVMCGFEESLGI